MSNAKARRLARQSGGVIGITFNRQQYNAAVNQQENIRVQELNEELSRKRSARPPSVSNAKARRLARQSGGG